MCLFIQSCSHQASLRLLSRREEKMCSISDAYLLENILMLYEIGHRKSRVHDCHCRKAPEPVKMQDVFFPFFVLPSSCYVLWSQVLWVLAALTEFWHTRPVFIKTNFISFFWEGGFLWNFVGGQRSCRGECFSAVQCLLTLLWETGLSDQALLIVSGLFGQKTEKLEKRSAIWWIKDSLILIHYKLS